MSNKIKFNHKYKFKNRNSRITLKSRAVTRTAFQGICLLNWKKKPRILFGNRLRSYSRLIFLSKIIAWWPVHVTNSEDIRLLRSFWLKFTGDSCLVLISHLFQNIYYKILNCNCYIISYTHIYCLHLNITFKPKTKESDEALDANVYQKILIKP